MIGTQSNFSDNLLSHPFLSKHYFETVDGFYMDTCLIVMVTKVTILLKNSEEKY